MFLEITNTPRDYAWGSKEAIPRLLGIEPTGSPAAEIWFGAHSASPSTIVEPRLTGGASRLDQWIALDPLRATGQRGRLPFLLKILAADAPLSLQVHPNPSQAEQGFLRENAAGIPLDSPKRNYRDSQHKPELIFALSPTFEALCGFRPVTQIRTIFQTLLRCAAKDALLQAEMLDRFMEQFYGSDAEALRRAVSWLLLEEQQAGSLISQVIACATVADRSDPLCARAFETVLMLAKHYPNDPGVVLSLLLNRLTLRQGEALYLPAGNIHAYLSGVGVEVMAASDNVLRGGLTVKHLDVPELLKILECEPLPIPSLEPECPAPGLSIYRPGIADFELVRVALEDGEVPVSYLPAGPAIALCLEGEVQVSSATSSVKIGGGHAFYITPDEGNLLFSGQGTLFLAAPGSDSTFK